MLTVLLVSNSSLKPLSFLRTWSDVSGVTGQVKVLPYRHSGFPSHCTIYFFGPRYIFYLGPKKYIMQLFSQEALCPTWDEED